MRSRYQPDTDEPAEDREETEQDHRHPHGLAAVGQRPGPTRAVSAVEQGPERDRDRYREHDREGDRPEQLTHALHEGRLPA